MFGVMMGALVLGGLADRIGRLKTLMISLIGVIVFEGFSAFSSSLDILISLRWDMFVVSCLFIPRAIIIFIYCWRVNLRTTAKLFSREKFFR